MFNLKREATCGNRAVFLADEFIEGARTHALSERLVGSGNVGFRGRWRQFCEQAHVILGGREEQTIGCPTRLRSFFDERLRKKRRLPRRGIEGFDAAGHGNPDARIGAAFDLFGKTGAFIATRRATGWHQSTSHGASGACVP